jgi:hypothetical protein
MLLDGLGAVVADCCMMYFWQAIKVLNMVKLHGKAIRINKASQDKNVNEVGANLFIGNLDPEVDEKVNRHSSTALLI